MPALTTSRTTRDGGFTLIELLVTIVIIGILSAIAIPNFLAQRQKAVGATQKADAQALATRMESYFVDEAAYPNALVLAGRTITFTDDDYAILSPGNVAEVRISPTPGGGYCVRVANAAWTEVTVYDSEAGGLQSGEQACGAAYAGQPNIVS